MGRNGRHKTDLFLNALKSDCLLDRTIVLLFFLGVILMPIHLRTPILSEQIRFGFICYPCVLAGLMTLFRIQKWERADYIYAGIWILMLIPVFVSNHDNNKMFPAFCMILLPLLFPLYRMDPETRKKTIGWFVLFFDVFIGFFLALGIVEQTNRHIVMQSLIEWLQGQGFTPSELVRYSRDSRFGSAWGHPLTSALLFNLFFAVNVVYDRSFGRKCPVLVYFVIALAGVLLASSKTGLVICFLLLIASSWKYKKWILLSIPVLILMYYTGMFDGIIYRFQHTTLTTGRTETLALYLQSGVTPFKWFSGYGTASVFSSGSEAKVFKAGLEFPELMFAYDYGIIFSLITMGGVFVYCTWRTLRKRSWLAWICYTLIFLEISSYNAYALRNQDVCILTNICVMVMLNSADALSRDSGDKGKTEAAK